MPCPACNFLGGGVGYRHKKRHNTIINASTGAGLQPINYRIIASTGAIGY